MINPNSKEFFTSKSWKELRKKVIDTYGERCQKCGYKKENGARINVDHIKPRLLYPELALDFYNLQVLCSCCNKDKGNDFQTDWRFNVKYENYRLYGTGLPNKEIPIKQKTLI